MKEPVCAATQLMQTKGNKDRRGNFRIMGFNQCLLGS